jgi:hypothetical protein|uniref:RNA-directed DNA polymerase n=1 Tax=Sipha flava TaxID=143950 RepID=A0A2S2QZI9_9HEMI
MEDEDGEMLVNWSHLNHTHLLNDAKQEGTFKSGRWGTYTNPDLCFVTSDKSNQPLQTKRTIQNLFPKSQHRPVIVDIGINLPKINKPEISRWNLRKANWDKYTKYEGENINRINPTTINYTTFIKLIKTVATRAIPRGHRKNYLPCWTKECERLLNEYKQNNSEASANRSINLLDEERRKRWESYVEELDFTHSIMKSWDLLRKLEAAHPVRKED